MPLTHSKSARAFKSNVSTLMREVGKSPKVKSRDQALAIAFDIKRRGRAAGGEVSMPPMEDPGPLHEGPVVSDVPGRTDKHNIRVKAGSYVLPSSHVASLAEDNTIGGFSVLDKMFKQSAGSTPKIGAMRGLRGPNRKRRADGGMVPDDPDVPIVVAGGEYVINPDQVMQVGGGDIKRGHEILDAWVKNGRKKHIAVLQKLPGPAKT